MRREKETADDRYDRRLLQCLLARGAFSCAAELAAGGVSSCCACGRVPI